jgi:hypothetical protein
MCHYGNSHGRKAFTLDKETLKLFKKQRKGKPYSYGKRLVETIPDAFFDNSENLELEMYNENGWIITSEEFNHFIESWRDYQYQSIVSIDDFINLLSVLKLSKAEINKIMPLIDVLSEYRHDFVTGVVDEYEETNSYYNYHKAIGFFVKHHT